MKKIITANDNLYQLIRTIREDQLKNPNTEDLKDIDKPELTPSQLDDIHEAVESGVSEFDFSDTDNFDKEFNIDYDNRIQLENFDFTNHTDLVEIIVEKVSKLFVEDDCPEDELDTTEADNHAVTEEYIKDKLDSEVS